MMSVEIGQQISHYKILEKLGEGGMGVVYKARDTSLNRFVALKFLPPHLTQVEENRNRFIVEAQAASALDHSNICNIHEINESDDGQRFICMAYYEGESLRQRIKNGPIPLDEAITILVKIAQGLKAAHEEKIIHRDIKPGNIIITKKGEVKIVDFGLAKLAGTEITRTTSSRGTAAYMCPEQIRGQKFDHRCDIWALGVVFYEMMTGHLPFEGDYPEPIMYAIVNEKPTPLSEYMNNVPSSLQTIFDRFLEKDPNKRYQNVADLLEDLQILTKNDHLAVIKTKPVIAKLFSRNKVYLYGSVAIFLAVLVLFFGSSYLFPDYSVGKLIIVIPVENVTIGEEQEDFSDGMTAMMINDLAQVSGLSVIHRTTAMLYKGTSKSPSEIYEELGVDYVVEPIFVKSGDQVKISATLINASKNQMIGAKTFDGEYKDVFNLFNELARSIASQIDPKFITQEQEQYDQARQVDPRALELYLKGYSLLDKHTKKDNNDAIDYFLKSIIIDSNFALPYVGLIHGYGQLIYWGDLPWEEGVSKVKKVIDKALQIDDQLAETYQALGALHLWQLWDWKGAGEAFQRAKDLNPNLTGFSGSEYSWYLITMGFVQDAITEAERLIQVDPLYYATRYTVGIVYNFAREYDKAIEFFLRTIELEPEDWRAYQDLAMNYEQVGRHDDAHQTRFKMLKLSGESPGMIAKYDSLYIELGPRAYPTWLLMKSKYLEGWPEKRPTEAAWIYACLNEKERALDWLEFAYEQKAGPLVTLNMDPKWDMIRDDPGFQDLLRRMNFPN